MKIDYPVPFYPNTADDTHCLQAAYRSVLKYFQPDQVYSWDELDRATAKIEGKWTWPMAGIMWFREQGFAVKVIDPFDYAAFAKRGREYLIEQFGKEVAREQEEHSDFAQAQKEAAEFQRTVPYENRVPTRDDVQSLLSQGYLIVCTINARSLNDRPGYVGHMVVIKGFDGENLIFHDPGSPPVENRQVSFTQFEKAWADPNADAKNITAITLAPYTA